MFWHRPIFPDRRQSSIFGDGELNFRVRNGNGWILASSDTKLFFAYVTIIPETKVFVKGFFEIFLYLSHLTKLDIFFGGFMCIMTMRIIKILLVLIIIVFFMPFFNVSCGAQDSGVNFSGFELSIGKSIGDYWKSGNPLGFALIILPAALLVVSFFVGKNAMLHNICKFAFFIAPILDIFAAFIVRSAFQAAAKAMFVAMPVTIETKFGFALYLLLNASLFVCAAVNYFKRGSG